MAGEATLALARRIFALEREKDKAVLAGQYEAAARLRDEREGLMGELTLAVGDDPVLAVNVKREVRWGEGKDTLFESLFPGGAEGQDARVGAALARAALPVRWVVRGVEGPIVGAVRERLGAGSLESVHCHATVPWIGYRTMGRAERPGEWLDVLERMEVRRGTPAVWVCGDVAWLEQVGVWVRMVERFGREGTEFVVCVGGAREGLVGRVLALAGVREIVVGA